MCPKWAKVSSVQMVWPFLGPEQDQDITKSVLFQLLFPKYPFGGLNGDPPDPSSSHQPPWPLVAHCGLGQAPQLPSNSSPSIGTRSNRLLRVMVPLRPCSATVCDGPCSVGSLLPDLACPLPTVDRGAQVIARACGGALQDHIPQPS